MMESWNFVNAYDENYRIRDLNYFHLWNQAQCDIYERLQTNQQPRTHARAHTQSKH